MAYSKVTVSVEGEVKSDDINQISDNIELALRGVGTNKIFARGSKQLTISSSGSAVEGSVTFATDADDGDPGFSTTPRVLLSLERVSGTITGIFMATIKASTLSSSGMTIQILAQDTQSDDIVHNVHWLAIGND